MKDVDYTMKLMATYVLLLQNCKHRKRSEHNKMVQLKYCPFLSINEVDIYLAYKYFVWSDNTKQPAFLQFRKQLAHVVIYNNHIKKDDDELTPTRKSK